MNIAASDLVEVVVATGIRVVSESSDRCSPNRVVIERADPAFQELLVLPASCIHSFSDRLAKTFVHFVQGVAPPLAS